MNMENLSPKYQVWVQAAWENLPPLNSIYTLLVIIATICITTRILSSTRSHIKQYAAGQARDIRQLPYWIPYIGHAISLGLGSVNFLLKTRFVFFFSIGLLPFRLADRRTANLWIMIRCLASTWVERRTTWLQPHL